MWTVVVGWRCCGLLWTVGDVGEVGRIVDCWFVGEVGKVVVCCEVVVCWRGWDGL